MCLMRENRSKKRSRMKVEVASLIDCVQPQHAELTFAVTEVLFEVSEIFRDNKGRAVDLVVGRVTCEIIGREVVFDSCCKCGALDCPLSDPDPGLGAGESSLLKGSPPESALPSETLTDLFAVYAGHLVAIIPFLSIEATFSLCACSRRARGCTKQVFD